MRKLYKDGKECMADDAQVALMKEAGWSTEQPKAEKPKPEVKKATAEEPKATASASESEEDKPTPKRIPKKKPVAKKSESEE